MKALFVGGGAGSWAMRGQQIGAALGARVTSSPTDADWRWADVAVLVKHAAARFAPAAQRFGVPIVWDVLDIWQQPHQNSVTIEEGRSLVQRMAAAIHPATMIAATQQMASDIGGVCIPHHCRIGLTATPPRDQVRAVAYDGSERYLGAWRPRLEAICQRRGWRFVVNPSDLSAADIIVALREGQWDGPICRAWKSGVKYSNAICAGRPVVTQESAALREMNPIHATVAFADELDAALIAASSPVVRERAYQRGLTARLQVDAMAETYYRPLLQAVLQERVCA